VAGGVLKVEGDGLMILTEYGGKEAPDELPLRAVVDVSAIMEAMEGAG